jgi:hypothetical protein
MAKQKMSAPQPSRQVLTGFERLGLRVAAMINHPVAQIQRWVTIHRLDSDGDTEWEQVLEILAATDELDLIFNDDGTITVRWQRPSDHDQVVHAVDVETAQTPAPF